MSVFIPEVQAQAKAASLLLLQKVREYFKDETHRHEFEDWYEQRHGEKYTWKRVTELFPEKEKPPPVLQTEERQA